MFRAAVLTLGCVSLIAGCSGEAGLGVPAQIAGETYPGDRHEMRGTIVNGPRGCLELEVDGVSHFVIWPLGSRFADRPRLPNGEVLEEGAVIVGTGALTPTAPLLGDRGETSYWSAALGFCAPDAEHVLVLDQAALAT